MTGPHVLAESVLAAASPRLRVVRSERGGERACDDARPRSAGATLHAGVASVVFVGAPGPESPLGVSVMVRASFADAAGACHDRMILVSSAEERALEAWLMDDGRPLDAELRQLVTSAGARIVEELLAARPGTVGHRPR